MNDRSARDIFLAWAESGGFAATHGAGASSEAIVGDLLAFLEREGWALVPREPTAGILDAGADFLWKSVEDPRVTNEQIRNEAREVWEVMFAAAANPLD